MLQTVGGYGPFKFDGHFAFSNFEEWGAKKIISSSKPIIFLSVHPREIELLGEDINNITKMVDELGYGM